MWLNKYIDTKCIKFHISIDAQKSVRIRHRYTCAAHSFRRTISHHSFVFRLNRRACIPEICFTRWIDDLDMYHEQKKKFAKGHNVSLPNHLPKRKTMQLFIPSLSFFFFSQCLLRLCVCCIRKIILWEKIIAYSHPCFNDFLFNCHFQELYIYSSSFHEPV